MKSDKSFLIIVLACLVIILVSAFYIIDSFTPYGFVNKRDFESKQAKLQTEIDSVKQVDEKLKEDIAAIENKRLIEVDSLKKLISNDETIKNEGKKRVAFIDLVGDSAFVGYITKRAAPEGFNN
jgi:hypothetical protein